MCGRSSVVAAGLPEIRVGRRRRLLKYVAQVDVERYRALIDRLGLRR